MPKPGEIKTLELQQLLDTAVNQGQKTLLIPPGYYRVPQKVKLSGVSDFTIEGYGATLVFPPEGEIFAFVNCTRLSLKGFSVDCDPLPFTQGTITWVSDDFNCFEYEIHAGYPQLNSPKYEKNGKNGVFVFAPDTLRWRQDIPDLYPKTSEILSPTQGRITLSGNLPGYRNIRVNDLVAFKNGGGNALFFRACDDVRLQDVTVLTAPLAGFLLRSCSGPVLLSHCVIKKGPTPAGATVPRLLSTEADGFNIGYSRQGATLEDCDFSFMGDDSVNLHGTILDVATVIDPKTFWIARTGSAEFQAAMRPGDTARFMDPKSFAVKFSAPIRACEVLKPDPELEAVMRKTMKSPADQRLFFVRFTLEKPVAVAVGDKLEIPEIACPNFAFRRNYFHDHRARGLRLGASHGVIEDNRFERLKSTAISLGPHAIHYEGGWVSDVIVRRNTISDVCFDDRSLSPDAYNAGAIVVQHFLPDLKTAYPQENRDISILDNSIDKVGGCGILATSAKGLTISGNKISGTQQVDCDQVGKEMRISAKAAISVNYSKDVIIKGNIFGPRGPYCREDVSENNAVSQ